MSSTTVSETASNAFSALDVALQTLGGLDWNVLPVADLLKALERLEIARRKATACACDLAAAVQKSDEGSPGDSCPQSHG